MSIALMFGTSHALYQALHALYQALDLEIDQAIAFATVGASGAANSDVT